MDKVNLAWNLFVELRKELVESQKLRAQIIGFKITFVSAAVGLIGTNIDRIPNILLVIPAFAAIFFDFLINSYSFSIKRIGSYIRNELEPILKTGYELPKDTPLWEEYLKFPETGQNLSFVGNLGLTLLAITAAVIGLCIPFHPILSSILLIVLVVLLVFDLRAFKIATRFRKDNSEDIKEKFASAKNNTTRQ